MYLLNLVWCRFDKEKGDRYVSFLDCNVKDQWILKNTACIQGIYCFLGGYIIPITYHQNQNNPLKRLRFWCCCDKSPDDGVDAVHMMPAMLGSRKTKKQNTFRSGFWFGYFSLGEI